MSSQSSFPTIEVFHPGSLQSAFNLESGPSNGGRVFISAPYHPEAMVQTWQQVATVEVSKERTFVLTMSVEQHRGLSVEIIDEMRRRIRMIANIDEAVKTVLLDDVHRVAVGPDSLFAAKGVDDAEGLPIVDHGSVFCSSVTEIDIDCIPGSQLARSIQDDHSVLQAYLLAANSGGATSFFPAPATNASRRVGRNVIARPPNCFILFRQAMHAAVVAANPGVHNNVISRLISGMWRESPPEIIEHYKALAELAKARHLHLYPNYRFTPRKSSDKKRRMTKKKAAALELATALAASVAGRVLPTDAVTRGEVVDHNASVGQANMEPQGSALGLEMVNGAALLQDEDITAASGAFVPREDFTVHITADHPDEIILDQAVADARQASAFADYHHNFRYHYEQLNGTMAPEISNYDAVINEAYVYDPPHYDAELNGLFFANE